jgi:uncharacterized protein YndB with AHSA1/START domain
MSEKKFSLSLKYVVYASPEKVFEALTNSSIIKKLAENLNYLTGG